MEQHRTCILNEVGNVLEIPIHLDRISIHVIESFAKVEVVHVIHNTLESPVESTFVFPLNASSSVNFFEVQVSTNFNVHSNLLDS